MFTPHKHPRWWAAWDWLGWRPALVVAIIVALLMIGFAAGRWSPNG